MTPNCRVFEKLGSGRMSNKKSKNNIFKELTYQQMFGCFQNYFVVTFDFQMVRRGVVQKRRRQTLFNFDPTLNSSLE